MVATAERTGLGNGVGHYMRFAEPIQTVRRLIEDGELGAVQALFGRIWQPRAEHEPVQWWMTEEECPAGSIGLLGVHLLGPGSLSDGQPHQRGDGAPADRRSRTAGHGRDLAGRRQPLVGREPAGRRRRAPRTQR